MSVFLFILAYVASVLALSYLFSRFGGAWGEDLAPMMIMWPVTLPIIALANVLMWASDAGAQHHRASRRRP